MSWRGSGNFGGSGGSGRNEGGSAFNGGSAGGPPLIYLIGAAIAVGVIMLIIALAVGASGGAPAAAVPAAAPTDAAAAQTTVAVDAAATAAAAAAAPAAATATPNPSILTEPVGPAVTTGSGAPLSLGSDGDMLVFDTTAMEATAGQLYTVSFKNNATAVQHNWVLVENSSVDTVVAAAAASMAKARNPAGAVPPGNTKGLLVAMPIINAGESGTVTFKAPAVGTYIFLCTFPGHYAAGMAGQLTVK